MKKIEVPTTTLTMRLRRQLKKIDQRMLMARSEDRVFILNDNNVLITYGTYAEIMKEYDIIEKNEEHCNG